MATIDVPPVVPAYPPPMVPTRALPASGESTGPSLKRRLEDWQLKLVDACREHPAEALAIAAGAGFVVGKLLHFAFRRRPPELPPELRRRRA